MGGLMKGLADGMQDSRSRDAESSAASANFRALDVESKAKSAVSSAEGRAETMLQGLKMWKQKAEELYQVNLQQTSKLSGCLIVINAMMKTMEEQMSPAERERFREILVERARSRMVEVDAKRRGTENYLDIVATFKKLPENKQLGVV